MKILSADETAAQLPYGPLAQEIALLLQDPKVQVAPRLVQALPGGGSLFVMPALDGRIAIAKLITFTPANAGTPLATIQGDVVVFDIASGRRLAVLDGPTVTARRTAAVTLLAAQRLAPNTDGPLLVVGAGAQGRAHVEALVQGLAVREVHVASRSVASAQALVSYALSLGVSARVVADADAAMADCPLVVTCTPAQAVVLRAVPRSDAFIAAVGAFTPSMVELAPVLCQHIAKHGRVVVDSRDADHEAGDLLQAGLNPAQYPALREVLAAAPPQPRGPVLFKSCGWAGWDLAAARAVVGGQTT